jgi:hypothetical protein
LDDHKSTICPGIAPILGEYSADNGYTTPDETFHCNFAFSGIDGDLLYDFIFPDRTLVVFTNDFGLGQAVERRPPAEPPADAQTTRKLVDDLFKKIRSISYQDYPFNQRTVDANHEKHPGRINEIQEPAPTHRGMNPYNSGLISETAQARNER